MVNDSTKWIMLYIVIIACIIMCLFGAYKAMQTMGWI